MTAMGWIVVLGAVGAYALLMVAWWRAVTKGPRLWMGPAHHPPQGHAPDDSECRPTRCKAGADVGNE